MNRFRQARIMAGYSQKEAAIILGISSPSISDWENGKTRPTNKHLSDMAKLYRTTTDYLLGIDPSSITDDGIYKKDQKNKLIEKINNMNPSELDKLSSFIDGMQAAKELYPKNKE